MSNKKDNKKPVDVKKLVLIAAVTVVVVLAAILVDNMIRHPRCQDETGALNVVIQKVLPSLDELADDEGFALEVKDIETIGDAEHYPVAVRRVPKCEDGEAAKRVVENRVLPDMNTGGEVELTKGALYFDSTNYSWAAKNKEYVATLGGHNFYR